jgi:Family of unknown function (DUF6325)
MTDSADVFGPIDFLLLEFSADKMDGSAAAALLDLVDRGVIRIYDLVVIRKDEDGTFRGLEISDLGQDELGGFSVFAGARSGLVGDDDIAEAGEAMASGTAAALLVYENTWAIPFISAAMNVDAKVIASARIPAEVVIEVLDTLEAADSNG